MISDRDLLEVALAQSTPSVRQLVRDLSLRDLAQTLPGSRGEQARYLAVEARKFITRRWPIWKKRNQPPTGATATDICFWRAARCGCNLPTDESSYRRILAA